jgi:hypothetical protein
MNFRDLVQSLLFYVGIPAFTLYPLGFAALAIQLWNDPLFPYYDFDTVWYAVTLVPQTQVIGTGLKLMFLSLVATALGVGIALRVSRFLHRRRGLSVEEKPEGAGRVRWAIYLLILLPLAAFLLAYEVILNNWADVFALAGFFVLSAGVGVSVGYMRAQEHESLFHTGLAVAYVGALFAALCLAAINPPSLPLVRVDAEAGVTPSCTKMSNKMFVVLATGSSYWHVFNKEGLYAVPSEQLKLVEYQHCPWYQIRGIKLEG